MKEDGTLHTKVSKHRFIAPRGIYQECPSGQSHVMPQRGNSLLGDSMVESLDCGSISVLWKSYIPLRIVSNMDTDL